MSGIFGALARGVAGGLAQREERRRYEEQQRIAEEERAARRTQQELVAAQIMAGLQSQGYRPTAQVDRQGQQHMAGADAATDPAQRMILAAQGMMERGAAATPTFQIGGQGFTRAALSDQQQETRRLEGAKLADARRAQEASAALQQRVASAYQVLQDPAADPQAQAEARVFLATQGKSVDAANAPGPQAPVRGTPEFLQMLRDEGRIANDIAVSRAAGEARARAQYAPPSQPPAPRPMTDGQRRAATTLAQLESELAVIEQQNIGLKDNVASRVPFGMGRFAMSDTGQAYMDAARSFAQHYIYALSGAAAPEQEVRTVMASIIPSPGDTEEAVRAKAARRRAMVENLRTMAGGTANNVDAPPMPSTLGDTALTQPMGNYSPNNPFAPR